MTCPKCKPICKCESTDPDWRHKEECPWLKSHLQSMSVQLYQCETFREWLRLGLKVFRIPPGFIVPIPWNADHWPAFDYLEFERHPFYKSFKCQTNLYGIKFWQWDPAAQHEVEQAALTTTPPDDKAP